MTTYINRAAGHKTEEDEARSGVTLVRIGKSRFFVATVRQGNSLIYLGKGTMEECTALYDEAKKKQRREYSEKNRVNNIQKRVYGVRNHG